MYYEVYLIKVVEHEDTGGVLVFIFLIKREKVFYVLFLMNISSFLTAEEQQKVMRM